MMDLLTRDDLQQLYGHTNDPCVTIFLPTFRKGTETAQNRIRFKNLLRKTESTLGERGIEQDQIKVLLQPAEAALADNDFWQHQSDGLAFFRSSEVLRSLRLPLNFPELVVVANRFHITPLISLIADDGRFYILALSLNRIRLLQATKYSASEVELKNIPTSLSEALKYDDPERQLQYHTGAGPASGGRAAVFHGQGKGVGIDDAERKKNILRFFQQVDNGLKKVLNDPNLPLVLVGVEYLKPLYREANSYTGLMNEDVTHNPEDLNDRELHEKAWEVIHPHFKQAERRAAEKYQVLSGSDKASNKIEEVVRESARKRIESLFINRERQVWGVFDRQTEQVEVHDTAQRGDEEMLNLAAVMAFINGGSVYTTSKDNMPDETDVAAVFRY